LAFLLFPTIILAQEELEIGDQVEVVVNGLRQRGGAGTDKEIIGIHTIGAKGTIIDGPLGGNGYLWWKVDWGEIECWTAEESKIGKPYLKKVEVPVEECSPGGRCEDKWPCSGGYMSIPQDTDCELDGKICCKPIEDEEPLVTLGTAKFKKEEEVIITSETGQNLRSTPEITDFSRSNIIIAGQYRDKLTVISDEAYNDGTYDFQKVRANIGPTSIEAWAVVDGLVPLEEFTQEEEETAESQLSCHSQCHLGYNLFYNPCNQQRCNEIKGCVFKNGVCEEEVEPILGKIVVLDPGHGGNDPGTTVGNIDEKVVNLDIASKLKEYLESLGIEVFMTRDGDTYVHKDKRSPIANDARADAYISIHANEHPTNPDLKGTEAWVFCYESEEAKGNDQLDKMEGSDEISDYCRKHSTEAGFKANYALAEIMLSIVTKTLGTRNMGIKAGDFTTLKDAKMPSVLIEVGYLSNEEDYKLLTDPLKQENLASAMSQGIQEYFA
jgi:N-acetylmuramoyl-L-alanine amidase